MIPAARASVSSRDRAGSSGPVTRESAMWGTSVRPIGAVVGSFGGWLAACIRGVRTLGGGGQAQGVAVSPERMRGVWGSGHTRPLKPRYLRNLRSTSAATPRIWWTFVVAALTLTYAAPASAAVPLTLGTADAYFAQATQERFPEMPADATLACYQGSLYVDEDAGYEFAECWGRWRHDGQQVHVYARLRDGAEQPELAPGVDVSRWARRWKRAACLPARLGRLSTNYNGCPAQNVGDLASALDDRRRVFTAVLPGAGLDDFTAFVSFRCHRYGAGYECRNAVGDAFRWRPRNE